MTDRQVPQTGSALALDADARPLPPWRQRADLSPMSSGWRQGEGAATMGAWTTAFDAMPPDEKAAYQQRYPAPLYWFWFWSDPGLGRTLLMLATFPLWMLVWAITSSVRGAVDRKTGE